MQFLSSSAECSSSGTDCSSVDPSWAAVCATESVPEWAPLHGLQLPSGAFSNVGSPWGSGGHRVLSWSPPQRNLYFSAEVIPPPFLTWVSAELFLILFSCASLSQLLCSIFVLC